MLTIDARPAVPASRRAPAGPRVRSRAPHSPPARAGLVALGLDDLLAAVVAGRADVMAQVHLAGGRLDRERRVGQRDRASGACRASTATSCSAGRPCMAPSSIQLSGAGPRQPAAALCASRRAPRTATALLPPVVRDGSLAARVQRRPSAARAAPRPRRAPRRPSTSDASTRSALVVGRVRHLGPRLRELERAASPRSGNSSAPRQRWQAQLRPSRPLRHAQRWRARRRSALPSHRVAAASAASHPGSPRGAEEPPIARCAGKPGRARSANCRPVDRARRET